MWLLGTFGTLLNRIGKHPLSRRHQHGTATSRPHDHDRMRRPTCSTIPRALRVLLKHSSKFGALTRTGRTKMKHSLWRVRGKRVVTDA